MKNKRLFKSITFAVVSAMTTIAMVGCLGTEKSSQTSSKKGKIKIGMTIDDLRLERWQHDRDLFTAKANELGAEVLVQSANGDDQTQYSQAENLISQGVDVLVVIPHNGEAMGAIVEEAHKNKIKVLAYDRLLTNCDLDNYISFDNTKVGELQAKEIIDRVPKGNYFLMGGSPTDNNAKLFREGQMNVLKPFMDEKQIKIVGDQWVKDWLPEEALKIMENALTSNNNKIDAVIASNDSTAGGAIQALASQKLDGKVAISGQDADLAACQRIVEEKQTMTVYKPIKKLATNAAEMAVNMAKDEDVEINNEVNNGKKDVKAKLLTPVVVNKDNMKDTIIKDGFHKIEEVYKNVPKDKWPK